MRRPRIVWRRGRWAGPATFPFASEDASLVLFELKPDALSACYKRLDTSYSLGKFVGRGDSTARFVLVDHTNSIYAISALSP